MSESRLNFHTKEIRGDIVKVELQENISVIGKLLEYYESNENIVIEDYRLFLRLRELASGSIIIIKGSQWKSIRIGEDENV